MRFTRRIAGYSLLDRKKSGYSPRTQGRSNYGFCPGIQEILERTCYQNEQQQIDKKMFKYVSCGQRSVGRPARRWIVTVTDQ
jgi:hypothetical protein